jgi:hypothetical protein
LNQVPLSVLEESLAAFRQNVLLADKRKEIPKQIYHIVLKEMILEESDGQVEEDALQNRLTL